MQQLAKNVKITEKIKEIELSPIEIEDDAYIILIEGWRMRVYFEKEHVPQGNKIKVEYTGDIKNPHSLKFKTMK